MKQLFIDTGFLATKGRSADRFLHVGQISNESDRLFFHLTEIASPWLPVSKANDIIVKTLNDHVSLLNKSFISFEDFENVILEINHNLENLAQKGSNEWLGSLNSIVGLIWNNEIFLSQAGNITGYLFRKNKISSITERKETKEPIPSKTFEDLTSGQITAGDRVVFGNSEFYNFLSLDRIRKATEFGFAKEAVFDLGKNLRKMKVQSANAVFIRITDTAEEPIDLSNFFYIDESNEALKKFVTDKAYPFLQTCLVYAKKYGAKAYLFTKDKVQIFNENWHKDYGPKFNRFIQEQNKTLKKGYEATSKTIAPKISKRLERVLEKSNFKQSVVFPERVHRSNIGFNSKKVSSALNKTLEISKIFFTGIINSFIFIFAKQNRKYLYLCFILIFIAAGYLKIRSNTINKEEANKAQELVNSLEEAKIVYDKAIEDIALGRGGSDSLAQALELANKAADSRTVGSEANNLIRDINEKLDEQIKATRIYSADLVSVAFSNKQTRMVMADSEIYSVSNEGKIYMLDTKNQDTKLVGAIPSDSGKIIASAHNSNNQRIYFYTDSNKIFEFDLLSKTHREISPIDSTWEDTVAIASFASNLYLLDSNAGEVWKHIGTDAGFEKGSAYLNTKNISIRGSVDLAIDGNIYLLKNDGTVTKFNRANHDADFALSGLPAPSDKIAIPSQIFTDENTTNLYIFDKKDNRLIIFDKSGLFQKQYIFDDFSVDQFSVNAKSQKAWLLSNDKIFEISL